MFNKMNMKKIVTYLLATMCIGFGVGFLILFSTGGISAMSPQDSKNSQKISEEKIGKIEAIEEVEIESSSADINVVFEKRADVRALLSGDTNKPELEIYAEGSKLHVKIEIVNGINLGFSNSNLVLNVQIPDSYSNNLKLISTSGNVTMKKAKLKNLTVDLSSGNTKLGDLIVDKFQYISTSGNLNGDTIATKNTVIDSSSGNIDMKKFSGELKANTTSADINVQYETFNGNADLQTSSGKVELSLPKNSEFGLNVGTSSGNIECKFPVTIIGEHKENKLQGIVGKENNKIDIETTSGDIYIIN